MARETLPSLKALQLYLDAHNVTVGKSVILQLAANSVDEARHQEKTVALFEKMEGQEVTFDQNMARLYKKLWDEVVELTSKNELGNEGYKLVERGLEELEAYLKQKRERLEENILKRKRELLGDEDGDGAEA